MITAIASAPALSAAQVEHFQREGYTILPHYMPANVLAAVRAECADEIAQRDADMEAKGLTVYLNKDNQATWVNHGVWYKITGTTRLSREQILKIAYSL